MGTWKDSLRERRQEAILEAAAAVFARKGYQAATVKEVAQEAGIAPGTIYLYFRDKRDLLLGIARQLFEILPQELPADVSADEARDFILYIMDEQLRSVDKYRPFFHAISTTMWTDDVLRAQFLDQVLKPIVNTLELFLQTGIDSGQVRPLDPQIISRAIVGCVSFFYTTSGLLSTDYLDPAHRQQLLAQLTDFFLSGVKASPPARNQTQEEH